MKVVGVGPGSRAGGWGLTTDGRDGIDCGAEGQASAASGVASTTVGSDGVGGAGWDPVGVAGGAWTSGSGGT